MATNNAVNTSLSGQTGTGKFAGATLPSITTGFNDTNGLSWLLQTATASAVNQVTLANAATGNNPTYSATGSDSNIGITFNSKGTSGINLKGISTTGDASAGYVGELISSEIAYASAVSITNNTAKSVTSISITAGDWDVYGNVFLHGSVAFTGMYGCISATNNTLVDNSKLVGGTIGANDTGWAVPYTRVSVASTTSYYLVVQAAFGGTATACGNIYARRVR